jgi:hypothetical protein
MKISAKYLHLSLFLLLIYSTVNSQQLTVDTKKIEALIDQWNSMHNKHNPEGFENIFDDHLLMYYAERMPKSKAKLLKKLLFVRNPDYEQRISSDIKYTLHTNGLVKCEFTKEIRKDEEWIAGPMYLLVGFKRHGYWVIGEGDPQLDKQLGFVPELGEPMSVEILSASSQPRHTRVESAAPNLNPEVTGTRILVPIDNILIYALVIFLGTGVFFIFFRDKISTGKIGLSSRRQTPQVPLSDENTIVSYDDDFISYDEPTVSDVITQDLRSSSAESYQVIENRLKQEAFKTHLLRLFDPMSFTRSENKDANAFGPQLAANVYPMLDLQYHDRKGAPVNLRVRSMYHEDKSQINLRADELAEVDAFTYVVVGLGGPPDCPHELFLIPGNEVKNPMSKSEMKSYRRSRNDVFIFNRTLQKLQ